MKRFTPEAVGRAIGVIIVGVLVVLIITLGVAIVAMILRAAGVIA